MSLFPLKPSHKPVKAYFAALATFQKHGHTTEGNTRSAFADLLKKCCSPYGWHLVEEYQFKDTGKQSLHADGALVDDLTLVHGLWEAKDTADDLQAEIKKKVAKGYPLTNTLFQSPTRAVLYQDNRIALDTPITEPEKLLEILTLFFEHHQAMKSSWSTVTECSTQNCRAAHYWIIGNSSYVLPLSSLPLRFFCCPPHCLKKKPTSWRRHFARTSCTQSSSSFRAPQPLSPPTITQ